MEEKQTKTTKKSVELTPELLDKKEVLSKITEVRKYFFSNYSVSHNQILFVIDNLLREIRNMK